MILQYVTQETLDDLNGNFDSYKEHYVNHDKDWFDTYFQNRNGLVSYDKEFPNFQMNMNPSGIDMTRKDPEFGLNEVENIKILYGALKELPLSVAWDERFWTGLSHTVLWDYIWFRRKNKICTETEDGIKAGADKDIKSSYLRIIAGRRGMFVNCVSRLWWAGYLTYDAKRKDPYELTRILAQKAFPSQMVLLSSRNFTSNKDVLHGILQALLDFEKQGYQVNRKAFEVVLTYLNNISAATILDFLSEEEIYQISKEQLEQYIESLSADELKKVTAKNSHSGVSQYSELESVDPIQQKVAEKPTITKEPVYAGLFSKVSHEKKKSRRNGRGKKLVTRTLILGEKK